MSIGTDRPAKEVPLFKTWQRERFHDFDGPIAIAACEHPEMRVVLERYALGQIVTKEEAMSQMVLELAQSLKNCRQELIKLVERCTFPPHIIPR